MALDEVTKGQEVFDIEHRSQLISMALAKTKGEIGSLLIPLRFPKALPKSFEWRYTSMLQNKIAHSKLATVVNVFPYECHAESFNDFLKKTFYTAKVMRFCFDPVSDGFLNRESMQRWLQVFCDQGFDGRVILSPRLESSAVLQGSLSQLSLLLKSYEI